MVSSIVNGMVSRRGQPQQTTRQPPTGRLTPISTHATAAATPLAAAQPATSTHTRRTCVTCSWLASSRFMSHSRPWPWGSTSTGYLREQRVGWGRGLRGKVSCYAVSRHRERYIAGVSGQLLLDSPHG